MKNNIFGILLISALLLTSCKEVKNNEHKEIAVASWLLGDWQSESAGGILTEKWQQENDSVYSAVSYFVHLKDTLHNEQIILSHVAKEVNYTSTIRGENREKPTVFKLTTAKNNQLVFENAANDFPKKIIYTKITADSLHLTISGMLEEKLTTEKYSFSKIKN